MFSDQGLLTPRENATSIIVIAAPRPWPALSFAGLSNCFFFIPWNCSWLFFFAGLYLTSRQTNCMTRMISRDYHLRYHSAYYKVYHRFLPKTYTKLFSIKGCCLCCCCFQCNFPYLIVSIRAWFAGFLHLEHFFAYLCPDPLGSTFHKADLKSDFDCYRNILDTKFMPSRCANLLSYGENISLGLLSFLICTLFLNLSQVPSVFRFL
jgi:hypothetical protein